MAERSSVSQVTQVGVESTPGTGVAANKLLQSIAIDLGIKNSTKVFTPGGAKWPTVAAQGKEWTEGRIYGAPTYDELQYIFASLITNPTFTQQGATIAWKSSYTPSQSSDDSPKTLTVEEGSAVRAHKAAYGIVTEFGWTSDRDTIDLNGRLMAQLLSDGITLTASPTALPLVPCLPKQVDVWFDSTSGALGTTKLTRVLKSSCSIKNRYSPLWVQNTANTSWVAHVETAPMMEWKLLLEADSNGMALLSRLRDDATWFLRWSTTGAIIASSFPYTWQVDTAVKVTDVAEFTDSDGVYAVEWTLTAHHDATWGKPFVVSLINTQTAL